MKRQISRKMNGDARKTPTSSASLKSTMNGFDRRGEDHLRLADADLALRLAPRPSMSGRAMSANRYLRKT